MFILTRINAISLVKTTERGETFVVGSGEGGCSQGTIESKRREEMKRGKRRGEDGRGEERRGKSKGTYSLRTWAPL